MTHRTIRRLPGPPGTEGLFKHLFGAASLSQLPTDQALSDLGRLMIETGNVNDPAGDNPNVPAGYTYFGQFVDHDVTFDPTSLREQQVDVNATFNFRTPALDLDCVYGSGGGVMPFMFERGSGGKFVIGTNSPIAGALPAGGRLDFDLPRFAGNGFALIGDPRNDENLVVQQLHLAFLKFHNKVFDQLTAGTLPRVNAARSIFEDAREIVTWHYQWIILKDFLARILDVAQLNDVLTTGRKLYTPKKKEEVYMPVEFSVAAYRLGHSMVRENYDYNRIFSGPNIATLQLLFKFTGNSGDTQPTPSNWIIDWRRFVDLDTTLTSTKSRKLDPYLIPQLHNLPGVQGEKSLAVRNLRRARMLSVKSAQRILSLKAVKNLGLTALTRAQIATGPEAAVVTANDFDRKTPLWYYLLKEAEVLGGATRMGPLGSRIIAEVFIGMIELDDTSFLANNPAWKPTLANAVTPDKFELSDMLTFVGDINPLN